MTKRCLVQVTLVVAAALLLGGCGHFSDHVSSLQQGDDIWIEGGAFSGPGLEPLVVGAGKDAVKYIPGQLIVKLREGKYSDQAIQALTARHGVQLKGRINPLRLTLVAVPAGTGLEAAKAKLQADADVESVGLNYVYELFGTSSPTVEPKHITNDRFIHWVGQWGMFAIGFHRIAAPALPTSAPIIAVVDSGVDWNHPDLGSAKVIKGPDYVDGDMDPMDTTGHGTHVAGIAAALTDNNVGVAGVSGGSKVLAIRVGSFWIPTFAAAAGITYAADYTGVKVINLSWGGPFPDPYILNAVQYAAGKGILVVAAAGNANTTDPMYPAAYNEWVLAVGATALVSLDGCPQVATVEKAVFSNYGPYVDIAAPGVAILSTVPGGGGDTSTLTEPRWPPRSWPGQRPSSGGSGRPSTAPRC